MAAAIVSALPDITDEQQLLSSNGNTDETNTVQYEVQYSRLPLGARLLEWDRLSAFSRLDPIKKRRVYVNNTLL